MGKKKAEETRSVPSSVSPSNRDVFIFNLITFMVMAVLLRQVQVRLDKVEEICGNLNSPNPEYDSNVAVGAVCTNHTKEARIDYSSVSIDEKVSEDYAADIQSKSIAEIKENAAKNTRCQDKVSSDRCASIAKAHGCSAAPGWMSVMCSATCNMCELLDPDVRCDADRINMSLKPAYEPGGIGAMFRSLPERFPEYDVTYLSQPPEGPWVARFDNFLNDEEVKALLQNTGMLQRSTDQGKFKKDGYQEQVVSQGRTSYNSWCMNECEKDPLVSGVQKRISGITGVPTQNFESFQLLRYEIGQEYRRHHDTSVKDNKLLCGPRILTFFMYLSDVEEGGGTKFTDLDITMSPKKGSAILWQGVLDSNLTIPDYRTHHHALPVIKGTKYAANSWIHLYDYRTPNFWGCTGAFTE